MKDILFKGKCIDDGEWIEGYYLYKPSDACMENNEEHLIVKYRFLDWSLSELVAGKVIPESVGQYTGVKDECGRKIFEKDIIGVEYGDPDYERMMSWHEYFEVYFNETKHAYYMRHKDGDVYPLDEFDSDCYVVGNIIDTPNFMEATEPYERDFI